MPSNEISITAVIPARNEASRIASTLEQVKPFVDEIIVIDDDSHDATGEIARGCGARVLTQPVNKGYIEAIKLGFREAGSQIVVTLDADGEFPAESIPALVAPIIKGYADMVQGERNRIPRPSERLINRLAGLKGEVGDSGTGLRAIRRDLARELDLKGACICGIFALEVIARGGRIEQVPIILVDVDKPRAVAWFHLRQLFFLIPWLLPGLFRRS